MEMTVIDTVMADNLDTDDVIRVESGLVTVVRRQEDYVDSNDDYVVILADDGEDYAFSWDQQVDLYGYTDSEE